MTGGKGKTGNRHTVNSTSEEGAYDSPLRMVTSEPAIHQLVDYLNSQKELILSSPNTRHTLEFSRSHINDVNHAFKRMICRGEESLHTLCRLLCDTFFNRYQIQSVVIGQVDSTKQRFTFIENLSVNDLYSTTDLDLGNRQIQRLKYFDGRSWSTSSLVANVVEYQPLDVNSLAIHKIVSRIKAEEEICNKVVDEIFRLDEIVKRDKILKRLSGYIKDVFGLKIIVSTSKDVIRAHQEISRLRWAESNLTSYKVPDIPSNERLRFVETKNYLGRGDRKRSGWEAMKSVVRWNSKTIEIQIQPLKNFLRERERLTSESHAEFKAQREQLRDNIAAKIPLFKFYRELLSWLFSGAESPPPEFSNVKIKLND